MVAYGFTNGPTIKTYPYMLRGYGNPGLLSAEIKEITQKSATSFFLTP
jgi:hypothetical protein